MRKLEIVFCGVAIAAGALGAGSAYGAIGLPDAESCSTTGTCLSISNTSSGSGIGILSNGAIGLYGTSSSASGSGVVGTASGTGSEGVYGSGVQNGVHGNGSTNGVLGQSSAASGTGVYGQTFGGSGIGVRGEASSTSSYGVYGSATGATATGVYGDGFKGVYGHSAGGYGVFAETVSGSSSKALYGRLTPVGAGYALYAYNPGSVTGQWAAYLDGRLYVTGTATCPSCTNGLWIWQTSDARLKKDIEPIGSALDKVMKLRPVTFKWKNPAEHGDLDGAQEGFIAQDVEKVLPGWVKADDKGFKTLNLNGLSPLLVQSIQTLKAENDAFRDRLKALETQRMTASAGLNGGGVYALAFALLASAVISTRRRQERRE